MANLILSVNHAVMRDPSLDLLDKLILSYVSTWEDKGKSCFAKDGFFASLFGVSDMEVRFSLHKLEALQKIDQICGTGGRLIRIKKSEVIETPVISQDIFNI